MPTFQHAEYVGEAIASVLAQTHAGWELIVVDDGSSDGTLEVVRRYDDPRIQMVARKHDGIQALGQSYRSALERSSAPLVAILEGDDRWPPDKLARQVADFEDEAVVLSYGAGRLIDERGCELSLVEPSFAAEVRTNRPTGAIVASLLSGNPILSPTVVVRRAALDAVGGFWQPDDVPYVDHPTWLLLAMQGAFAYHSSFVGYWRRHQAQWTTRIVDAESVAIPEAAYVGLVADRFATLMGKRAPTTRPLADVVRAHLERALLNRWRLALLSGGWREIGDGFVRLVRSGRPKLIGLAVAGLAMRAMGSDLEWIQARRKRVAWPSRRHVRQHAKNGSRGG